MCRIKDVYITLANLYLTVLNTIHIIYCFRYLLVTRHLHQIFDPLQKKEENSQANFKLPDVQLIDGY